jgi:hypothetical protein
LIYYKFDLFFYIVIFLKKRKHYIIKTNKEMIEFTDEIDVIVRMQNVQLLKYIAFKEEWDFVELCKQFLR